MITEIFTCDKKYRTVNDNGKLTVYRNGEEEIWREKDLIGDGYVLSLVQEIERLTEDYEKLLTWTERM